MADVLFPLQVVASQDWPEVTKYAGLVCAQAHRQELIQDLYKTWQDPVRGTVSGGMIRYIFMFLYIDELLPFSVSSLLCTIKFGMVACICVIISSNIPLL